MNQDWLAILSTVVMVINLIVNVGVIKLSYHLYHERKVGLQRLDHLYSEWCDRHNIPFKPLSGD